ncbi:biotin-[acetylCoA carboxylase] holoenzyme synthetase and biotin operon repressor [Legionella busanensis]|uniref:Bifunctional ligase/repressor BirA n=1 Tax=Legionella busanensis TaxID=190655 RepID=A0A378JKD7_9GAMM|nr:biotin--[acetyl-CoA-carboxylase] ligase [Legionella busanensis]STX51201.1 biotin-[acetylCoA carboxylase] holoenzyme synthetase and biotin operon repressor [Legionella busanensis]
MKRFTPIQYQLLDFLANGDCKSGNAIAKEIGVSRTAIWKQISQLTDFGLDIQRNARQGYQLTHPFIALHETTIRQYLEQLDYKKPLDLHLFAEIDSTNRYLKDLPSSTITTICCAETQTQGRGRFGRTWVSPFGENIYFSGRWQLNCCISKLSGLSLVISLAILSALKSNNIQKDIYLKWPNDLMWQHKKLAGVLIELIAEANSCIEIIIGIGININTKNKLSPELPWCSLYDMTSLHFNRNQLIASLITTLDLFLQQFLDEGFKAFHDEWQQVDYLDGQYITVFQPNLTLSGYVCGVNELGQLRLIDDKGKCHYLSSGDTSLKNQAISK